jgi:methionyl-tRNA formyltransferase
MSLGIHGCCLVDWTLEARCVVSELTSYQQASAKPRRVLLAGQGPLAYEAMMSLLQLTELNAELIGFYPWFVVKQAKASGWRGASAEDKAMLKQAKRYGVKVVHSPGGLNDPGFLSRLKEQYQIDTVLIVSWGEKITPESLDKSRYPLTWLNIHPSLLPAHRGPNPYISTIRFGETESGLSLHLLDQHWDTGPLLHQEATPIQPFDTGGSLRASCQLLIPALLRQGFETLREGKSYPQLSETGSYYSAKVVNQNEIDWTLSPQAIERWHRAVQPWFCLTATSESKHHLLIEKLCVITDKAWKTGQWPSPGTLLKVSAGGLQVASSQPGTSLLLERYRLGEPLGWWYPTWLSRWQLPCLLQPGSCFIS